MQKLQSSPYWHSDTHHSIEQVEGAQADGLILVIQALKDQILVGLHGLGMCLQDFRHGQQSQVLYCEDQVAISLQILRGIPWSMGATGGICHHFWPLWLQLVLTAGDDHF